MSAVEDLSPEQRARYQTYEQELARPPRPALTSTERTRRYREKMKQEKTLNQKPVHVPPKKKPKTRQVKKFINTVPKHTNSATPMEPYSKLEFTNPITPEEMWKLRSQWARFRYRTGSHSTPLSPSEVVQGSVHKYRPLFPGESLADFDNLEKAADSEFALTVVTVLIPYSNITENFPVCTPKYELDYDPTSDLSQTASFFMASVQQDIKTALEQKLGNALRSRCRTLLLEVIANLNSILTSLTAGDIEASKLHHFLVQQSYDRSVRPHNRLLEHGYKPFSSETYGEMMPQFIQRIIGHHTLDTSSLVVDLGCGVGNVVSQISICTGAAVYGIEIRKDVAAIANLMVKDTERRSKMWGVTTGSMTVLEGDLLTNAGIRAVLGRADLIICNNFQYEEPLNQALFDLLDGTVKASALIVTLVRLGRSGVSRSGRPLHANVSTAAAQDIYVQVHAIRTGQRWQAIPE
ncbi:Nucleosomal histone H3-Lys79 methylase [Paramarasmius palmivorus]|uniref:Histone-lysine N-methyltransferase, H3 lysine-79 specific n=1 Tax=Paramarasmius palmivorus TaxID=297713 RepID=A0AAW0BTI6_9AGAR